jgi:hypothetical protein
MSIMASSRIAVPFSEIEYEKTTDLCMSGEIINATRSAYRRMEELLLLMLSSL